MLEKQRMEDHICIKCNAEFELSYDGRSWRKRKGISFDICPTCLRSENTKNQHGREDPEKKKIRYQLHSIKLKQKYDAMTDEEKEQHNTNLIYGDYYKDRFNSLPEEEKEKIKNNARKNVKKAIEHWKNCSPEDREEMLANTHQGWKKWRDNLTDAEMQELRSKQVIAASGKNKFHQKFEQQWSESVVSQRYELYPEQYIKNIRTGVSHTWDYGVRDKLAELPIVVILIDLDGNYYHADNGHEYDGIHSKEEYDEKRGLSVSLDIPFHIIYEHLPLGRQIEKIVQLIDAGYEDTIRDLYQWCRSNPFPYPSYSDEELRNSYKRLKALNCNSKYQTVGTNTKIGDHIIGHFHHSIYSARCGNNPSPYEAWQDEDLVLKCIMNRYIYVNTLNPSKVVQGFNINKIAPKVSVFSAGRAKLLVSDYLSEFDTVFDPFSGFSGRMLGVCSLGKKYIGQDLNPFHVEESNDIIKYYGLDAVVTVQSIESSKGSYPCLFTCPPYGTKEKWTDQVEDSLPAYEYIDLCLNNFKCERYVFVVDEVGPYEEFVANSIMSKSHFSRGHAEKIVVINSSDL
jgi:hypothetical protein